MKLGNVRSIGGRVTVVGLSRSGPLFDQFFHPQSNPHLMLVFYDLARA